MDNKSDPKTPVQSIPKPNLNGGGDLPISLDEASNITPLNPRLSFYKSLNDIQKEFNLPPTPISHPVVIRSPNSIRKFLNIEKDLNLTSSTRTDTLQFTATLPNNTPNSTINLVDITVHECTQDASANEQSIVHKQITKEDSRIIINTTHKEAQAIVPFLGVAH